LEAQLTGGWTNSLFGGLAVWTLMSPVEYADVLRVLDAVLIVDVRKHLVDIIHSLLIYLEIFVAQHSWVKKFF
jgi:hypothetical protein